MLNRMEKELLNSYFYTYRNTLGMETKTAKQAAKMNVIVSKDTAIKEGVYSLPSDYWKVIFEMEKNNSNNLWVKYYTRARNDGVNDDDIIYFWETYSVERYMMQETQNIININAMLTALNRGKTMDEASAIVRKKFPTYGNPSIKSDFGTEDDNFLPLELVFRVNKNIITNLKNFQYEIEKHSSFNAFIRSMARTNMLGKL
jgi:hypothetical protein